MTTLENTHKVCLVLFLILGGIHITSSLMISNGYSIPETTLINRTLDIPVIATGLGYALTSLKLSLSQKKVVQQTLNILIILIMLGAVGIVSYINFFLTDI